MASYSCSSFSRRSFLTTAAGAAAWSAGCSSSQPSAPPNIVMLLADDLGYGDLSSYDAPDIRTPHIDSLGAQGVRFTHCYANAPECTPTRTAFLTGRYQQRVGGLECAIGVGNVGRYDEAIWLQERGELGLPATEPTLGRVLKNNGYDTACIGKWHLGYLDQFSPNRHGFDHYFGILGGNADYFRHTEAGGLPVLYENGKQIEREGYATNLFAEESVAWLKQRTGRPFFLYVPFNAPHTPIQGPDDKDKVVTEENWGQGDRATYARMVESMDDAVGRILAQLDSMGAAGNTLVVFQSDNGGTRLGRNDPFRAGKGRVYEGGIRVPGLVRWPAAIPAGQTSDQVNLTMDLMPTFLAAAGIDPPANREFDGVNLLPVLRGERDSFPRLVFWGYKRGENRREAVRYGQMKYAIDNGEEGLYHLGRDQSESMNLMEEMPGVAEDLKQRLSDWEEEVRAPRLAGFPA